MTAASVLPHDISSTAISSGGIWKWTFSSRSGDPAASSRRLLGYDDEFVARIASDSARRSSSRNTCFLSARSSDTDSMMSHAVATAGSSASKSSTVPGDLSASPGCSRTEDACSSTKRLAASREPAERENSCTWLPPAENIMAMRRPSVPPPITEIGRSSTSLGRTYDMACMFAHRRG